MADVSILRVVVNLFFIVHEPTEIATFKFLYAYKTKPILLVYFLSV
jgi:hypothetical protein